jgi:hypothetical protein
VRVSRLRVSRRFSIALVLAIAATLTVAPVSASAEAPAPETVEAEITLDEELVDAADGRRRTEPTEASITFNSLWLTLSSPADEVVIRTSVDGETWDPWTSLGMLDSEDGPDEGTDEAAATEVELEQVSELLWADEANWFQLEVPADVDEVDVRLIDTEGLNESILARAARTLKPRSAPAEASSHPSWINPRSAWGAASPTNGTRAASQGVSLTVVHHTATSNDYTRAQVPARIRSMQSYHQGLGWTDLGYNVVIDRFGGVWEGRAGGLDRAIIGAHASGFNTGSFGVSVIGNFVNVNPTQASLDSLARVIGWKATIHGFDPGGTVHFNGARRPVVLGHRDVGQTACPGRIANYFSQIRSSARAQAFPFKDISGNTHAPAIMRLSELKNASGQAIVSGYSDGTFRPDRAISRAEVATLLARLLDLDPIPGQRFADVPRGSTHEGAINARVDRGILKGYDTGRFHPNEPLRRDHMAVILERGCKRITRSSIDQGFVDVPSRYRAEINGLARANVTNGCATNPLRYCPDRSVNRGEMASFLDRARPLR